MNKRLSIPSKFELLNDNVVSNSNFKKVKIYIQSDGVNYNNSSFTVESMQEAMKTIDYIPILGYIKETDGYADFDGHNVGYDIQVDSHGETTITEIYEEIPIGVITSKDSYIEHIDGKNFLVAYGFIWKSYGNKAIEILERDMEKEVSMEITVESGDFDENGIFAVSKYEINGVTVLGADVPAAIEGSKIQMSFSKNNEYKNNLKEIDKILQKFVLEGGDNMDEEKAQVEQEVEEPTVEQEEAEEVVEIPVIVEEQGEVEEEMACGTKKKKKKCSADEEDEEVEEEMACGNKKKKRCAEDEEDVCPKCGKPMSECECDDEEEMACGGKKKKKKCSSDEEDELEPEEICTSCGQPLAKCKCMEDREKAKEEEKKDKKYSQEELDEAIANVRAEYAQIMEELEGLREFKAEYDKQIRLQQLEQSMDEIASNFNVEESIVKELRAKVLSGEYSMDKFELELYRNNAPIKKEFSKKENKLPVIDNEKKTSEIDAFFNKYLRK